MKSLRFIGLLWSLCLYLSVQATPKTVHYEGVEGLSSKLVNCIYRDGQGFVWIGTDKGLDRYDGVQTLNYQYLTTDNIKFVYAIAETPDHTLWTGTELGLWKVNAVDRTLQTAAEWKLTGPVYALCRVDSQLVVGSETGLYLLADDSLKMLVNAANRMPVAKRIRAVKRGGEDHLWLLSSEGLVRYQLTTGQTRLWKMEEKTDFTSLEIIGDTLYMGSSNRGVLGFDCKRECSVPMPDVKCNFVSSLSQNGDGRLYIGTNGNGAYAYSPLQGRIVAEYLHDAQNSTSVSSNSVYSLLKDADGILWIGQYQHGAEYELYQHPDFQVYSFGDKFTTLGMQVRTFWVDEEEKLIGTRSGLYYVNERTGVVKEYVMPQLRSNLIYCSYRCGNDFWIGTFGGGLSILNGKTLQIEEPRFEGVEKNLLTSGPVFCMEEDGNGDVWIGLSDGVLRYQKATGTARYFNYRNSDLPKGEVRVVLFDSTGRGWLSCEEGLMFYNPLSETFSRPTFQDNHRDLSPVSQFQQLSKEQMMVVLSNGKLGIIDNEGRFSSWNKEIAPFPDKNYNNIHIDKRGWLWITSGEGVLVYDPQSKRSRVWGYESGLPSSAFTSADLYEAPDGSIWMGNTCGLVKMDPDRVQRSMEPSHRSLIFTQCLVNGKEYPCVQSVKEEDCPSVKTVGKMEGLQVLFAPLLFSRLDALTYEYKLEGYQADWQFVKAGSQNISYADLPYGTYTLLVRLFGEPDSTIKLLIVSKPQLPVVGIIWSVLLLALLVALLQMWHRIRKKEVKPVEEEDQSALEATKEEEKYKSLRMSDAECEEVLAQLKEYMDKSRAYSNMNLRISELAAAINTQPARLSYLFNQYLQTGYNDFVNEYRVNAFQTMIQDGALKRYTLDTVAEKCGFSSRASFYRSFKKVTGITPSEYVSKVEE